MYATDLNAAASNNINLMLFGDRHCPEVAFEEVTLLEPNPIHDRRPGTVILPYSYGHNPMPCEKVYRPVHPWH